MLGGRMAVRRPDVPRQVARLGVALIVVPAVLWLFAVWNTRPYSPEEISADRARVEATRDSAPDMCNSQFCFDSSPVPDTYLEREALDLTPEPWDVSALAVLAMAAISLLIGALWPPAPGIRQFLRRAALVGTGTWLVAAEVGVFWWLGLSWISSRRGIHLAEFGEGPWFFVQCAALFVGLAGLTGVAARVLVGGGTRAVLTVAGVAVAAGVVLLSAKPDRSMAATPQRRGVPVRRCVLLRSSRVRGLHASRRGFRRPREFCTREGTRTTGASALYLLASSGFLVAAASLTSGVVAARGKITDRRATQP